MQCVTCRRDYFAVDNPDYRSLATTASQGNTDRVLSPGKPRIGERSAQHADQTRTGDVVFVVAEGLEWHPFPDCKRLPRFMPEMAQMNFFLSGHDRSFYLPCAVSVTPSEHLRIVASRPTRSL